MLDVLNLKIIIDAVIMIVDLALVLIIMLKPVRHRIYFYMGATILLLLEVAHYFTISVDDGANYIIYDTLLGILTFHNPFIFIFYLLIGIVLIVKGLKK